LDVTQAWPEPGGRVVWESTPDGRGRVTETVTERAGDRFSTQVYEQALAGRQTLRALPASDGSEVELSLEYELAKYGPLRGVADALFIRRALRDALRRTLFRFGVEAEEQAQLT
jgi:hypothetical protein